MMLAAILLAAAPVTAAPLDPFVGSCWAADFTPTMRDTHCFEAMYGGAHVRDRHEVKEGGKTVYAGETIYSVEGEQAVFTYFNSLGGVGRGSLAGEGPLLRFKGDMRASPDKPQQPIDSEWRVVDDDHYEVRSLVKSPSTGGNKVLRFTRVK
jgi:hypothetical protein